MDGITDSLNMSLNKPWEQLLAMKEEDWKCLDKDGFEALFKHSAMQRAGYEGLKRNIEFISKES